MALLISYNEGMRLPQPLRFVVDALFPPRCLACETFLASNTKNFLCEQCAVSICVFDAAQCPRCGARLPEGKQTCHNDAGYVLFAAASYGNVVVRKLIRTLKYDSFERAAIPIAYLISLHLEHASCFFEFLGKGIWVAIPIPLHPRKERKRGFNQATIITKELIRLAVAFHHSFPQMTEHILLRTRATESQTKCEGSKERAENVSGAFTITHPETVRGKNVLLIDDVFTSGATMNEAVRALKKNGANKIFALVAAKA